jgi:hypothetical protein
MQNKFWGALILVGLVSTIARSASADWFDYTHQQSTEIAIANVNPTINGVPAGNGLLCNLAVQQGGVTCYAPAGTRQAPDVTPILSLFDAQSDRLDQNPREMVRFSDTPSHRITSFTLRPVPTSLGGWYYVYVLRADNTIWARMVDGEGGDTFRWSQLYIGNNPPVVARQIFYGNGQILIAATDNHIYHRSGFNNIWSLYTSAPGVAIFGGDDTSFVTLNGTSGTSTALSAISPNGTLTPPDVSTTPLGSLMLSNSNPDIAFSLAGRSNPVSCNGFGCYALRNTAGTLSPPPIPGQPGGQEPAIFFWRAGMTQWAIYDTAYNTMFGPGGAVPHTIVAADNFRGIRGDIFVAQGNGHFLEWIPPS